MAFLYSIISLFLVSSICLKQNFNLATLVMALRDHLQSNNALNQCSNPLISYSAALLWQIDLIFAMKFIWLYGFLRIPSYLAVLLALENGEPSNLVYDEPESDLTRNKSL